MIRFANYDEFCRFNRKETFMDKNSAQRNLEQKEKQSNHFWLSCLFFPMALVYHEILLRIFDKENVFFTGALFPVILFALAAGFFLTLLFDLLPARKLSRICAIVLTALWTVYVCVEYCCKSYFKIYFGVGYMANMTGNVLHDFGGTMFEVILARIPFILLSLLPLLFLILGRMAIIPEQRKRRAVRWIFLILVVLFQLIGSLIGNFGPHRAQYTYNFNANDTLPQFGLASTLRLEAEYAIFGMPDLPDIDIDFMIDQSSVDHPQAILYDYNKLDIDFQGLVDSSSGTMQSMHRYFNAKVPTQKNEYTGMFAGKNLILITAEAFCPYAISEELTPTLYRLSHEGFVFDNYYQPGWGQSTTGGEFAVMTGLIPTWVNNQVSFYVSSRDSMPFALGHQFAALGYTTKAWHNNTYTYYDRDKTHPNLGYDYVGVGNGLSLTGGGVENWPYSDLEMMQKTVDEYLDPYVNNGTPFHAYYMTVSGHANWGWGNSMASKNRDAAVAAYPNASQPVQGYIAANLELEAAMTYLLERLDEAGALDDTVICMSADHYPYALVEEDRDYYQELSGIQDTEQDTSRYRNTLILWCGSMEQAVKISIPCSAVDIVPTLSNLFGLSYDSRLLSGRDILAPYTPSAVSSDMPLVILPTTAGNSWETAAGIYEAKTGVFTPNPGVTVPEYYVAVVNNMVDAKYTYAKAIIQYDYYNLVLGDQTE